MMKFRRDKLGLIILGIVFLSLAYTDYQSGVATLRQGELYQSESPILFFVEILLKSGAGILLLWIGLFAKSKK